MNTTTNTGAASLSDEQIEALKAAALAATPQDIDSAERIETGIDGQKYMECPHCGGEGSLELEADYCNYDDAAIGVQFYGIGTEFGAAEAYFRAASPANILALIQRLKRAESATTPQAGAAIADWRNLYEMVYGHECSFKSFMATVDELSRVAAIAAGGAQEAAELRAIHDLLHTQDNRITAAPSVEQDAALLHKEGDQ